MGCVHTRDVPGGSSVNNYWSYDVTTEHGEMGHLSRETSQDASQLNTTTSGYQMISPQPLSPPKEPDRRHPRLMMVQYDQATITRAPIIHRRPSVNSAFSRDSATDRRPPSDESSLSRSSTLSSRHYFTRNDSNVTSSDYASSSEAVASGPESFESYDRSSSESNKSGESTST